LRPGEPAGEACGSKPKNNVTAKNLAGLDFDRLDQIVGRRDDREIRPAAVTTDPPLFGVPICSGMKVGMHIAIVTRRARSCAGCAGQYGIYVERLLNGH
jgi:hypothetical protein